MRDGLVVIAALAAAGPAMSQGIECVFTRACIDGRACFDSRAEAHVTDGADGPAILAYEGRRLAAGVGQEGIWRSYRTAPDIDHDNRVLILDVAPDGRAVLVVSRPGSAAAMVSRDGTCQPWEGTQ